MKRKIEERERAREMRRAGASLREISEALGVAKSTASLWVRDIPLSEARAAELLQPEARLRNLKIGHLAWSRQKREFRAQAQDDGRRRARAGDPLHQAGCMIYWGEGSKTRNSVILTNSDADMLAFFLRFLRECYDVGDEQVALTINCFLGNGMTLEEIEAWWLQRLNLPASCLRKAAVNRPSRASKGVRPQLLYGTARIAVGSTYIVQSIYGAIQEYAGCERPEWLDLGVRLPAPDV